MRQPPCEWHRPPPKNTLSPKRKPPGRHAVPATSVRTKITREPPCDRETEPQADPPPARACDRHALLRHMTPRQVLGCSAHFAVSARGGERFTRASVAASVELFHLRGKGPPVFPREKIAPHTAVTTTWLILRGFVAMPILVWCEGKRRLSRVSLREEHRQLRTHQLPGLLSLTSPKFIPRTLSSVAKFALFYLPGHSRNGKPIKRRELEGQTSCRERSITRPSPCAAGGRQPRPRPVHVLRPSPVAPRPPASLTV